MLRWFSLIVLFTQWLAPAAPQPFSDRAPLAQYHFDIQLDYFAHRLEAEQHLTFTNTFGEGISEVVFNVPAAHSPGVFSLERVVLGDAAALYNLSGTLLKVKLPVDLEPNQAITLSLQFTINVPPLDDPQSFAEANLAYTPEVMNVGYWYPLLAPYRAGTGWITAPWYPIGDPFVSESADYTAVITAAPGVTVAAGGELLHDQNVWRIHLPRARTFGLIASPLYQTLSLPFGGVTYTAYTLPWHTYLAPVTLETAIQAEHLYSYLYGPYPYSTLRLAEFSGPWSMEYAGFAVLGASEFDSYDDTPRNRLIRVTAHEVSHQWWYNVVGNDQVREPWLDEGLARFNELRYYEAYAPQDAAWWWHEVIGTQIPTRPLNSPVTAFNNHGSYLTSIYNQGARFLDALRQSVGQPAFNTFLRDLFRRESFRLNTTQEFIEVLKEHTQVDLRPLTRRFFRQ